MLSKQRVFLHRLQLLLHLQGLRLGLVRLQFCAALRVRDRTSCLLGQSCLCKFIGNSCLQELLLSNVLLDCELCVLLL